MKLREMMLTTEATQTFCVHTVKDAPRITSRITGTLEDIESNSAFSSLLDMEIDSWGVVDDMIDVTVLLDSTQKSKPLEVVWFVEHEIKRLSDKDVLHYVQRVAPDDGFKDPDTFLLRGFYAGMTMTLYRLEERFKALA